MRFDFEEEKSQAKALESIEKILQDPGYDLEKVRADFSYLKMKDPAIIYLDNAATTQRPDPVIDRVGEFYRYENANPLRGNHKLSLLATQAYEDGREKVKELLNARQKEEILFTRNASESLNLVSYLWALHVLKPGDEVLITRMEHHSNCVNWQFACQKSGAILRYIDLDEDFHLDQKDFLEKLNDRTKVVAFSGASNVLSTVPDAKGMIEKIHQKGAIAVMDAAQAAPHEKLDVQDLDCDFLAFSGHKMLSPFGIGVLYGKREILEKIPPFLYGGEMIEYVQDLESSFAPLPYKFEAGTQNVGGVVGLSAAIDYLNAIGLEKIERYEKALAEYCAIRLREIPGTEIYRPQSGPRGAAVAFNLDQIHPHDVSTIVDTKGVAIRSGHHCTQPLHRYLGISASCRASVAFYNTKKEVDQLIEALQYTREVMGFKEA